MHRRIRVLEPATTQDLTTLETARVELDIPEADTSQDAQIQRMIHEVSSIVATYCNQVFGEEMVEETFWPESCCEHIQTIVLDRMPVTSVIEATLDGTELGTGDFQLDEQKGILYRLRDMGCCCSWSIFREFKITYTAGYPLLDGLPFAIERATLILMKDQFLAIGRDPNLRSESIPGVHSYTFAGGGGRSPVTTEVAALLDSFRNYSI